jgi:ABC-type lipopolysaccharide export system ATPase subunit
MASILEIDSVQKAFDTRQVLTDIYLKCRTGDIIGMLGRNGSGKSTLLKILFGTMPADSKYIRIDGFIYQYPFLSVGEVAYLPQHSFLLRHLTVYKTAELYLRKQQLEHFFDDQLIGRLQKNKISGLSGGEQRYLEIKLLLNLPAKFLLLDEPFNGVAPIMVEQLKQMISAAATTKGIILTDHDYENVLDVATRYCLVYDGGIKTIETRQDLVRWQYLTGEND